MKLKIECVQEAEEPTLSLRLTQAPSGAIILQACNGDEIQNLIHFDVDHEKLFAKLCSLTFTTDYHPYIQTNGKKLEIY